MTQLIDDAADALERRLFFDQLSSRYEALRADPPAWREIESERDLESGALRRSPNVTARRGEVWLVDFGNPVGREQSGPTARPTR